MDVVRYHLFTLLAIVVLLVVSTGGRRVGSAPMSDWSAWQAYFTPIVPATPDGPASPAGLPIPTNRRPTPFCRPGST